MIFLALMLQTILSLPFPSSASQASTWPIAPILALSQDHKIFSLTFRAGAAGLCTIFEQQQELAPNNPLRSNFPAGKYAPRHCQEIGNTQTTARDDWDYVQPERTPWKVWAEVQYSTGMRSSPTVDFPSGEEVFIFVKSNVVEVVR
jgi:hypothetical protein